MTSAGRVLGLTQSAVSQAVRSLEEHFGVQLLDRERRPLRLTPAGEALRFHAVQMIRQAELTRAEIRQTGGGVLHHLRLAVLSTLASTLVPSIVGAVVSREIGVQSLTILRGLTSDHRQALLNREVDIVISSNPLGDYEGLERHDLMTERLILALPTSVRRQSGLKELAATLPLLRYVGRTQVGWMAEQHLRRMRLEPPHTLAFESSDDLFAAIAAGRGWAIVAPSHAVHALSDQEAVRLLPLPGASISRAITLVGRSHELGAVPTTVTGLLRAVLASHYVPRAQRLIPWLGTHVALHEGGDHADEP